MVSSNKFTLVIFMLLRNATNPSPGQSNSSSSSSSSVLPLYPLFARESYESFYSCDNFPGYPQTLNRNNVNPATLESAIANLKQDIECTITKQIADNPCVLNEHIFDEENLRHWFFQGHVTDPLTNRSNHSQHHVWTHPSISEAVAQIKTWLSNEQNLSEEETDIFFKFALFHSKVEKQFPKPIQDVYTDSNENKRMVDSLIESLKCPISNNWIENPVIYKGKLYEKVYILKHLVDLNFNDPDYPGQEATLKDITFTTQLRDLVDRAIFLCKFDYLQIDINSRGDHVSNHAHPELLMMALNNEKFNLQEGDIHSMFGEQNFRVYYAYESPFLARNDYNEKFGTNLPIRRFRPPSDNQNSDRILREAGEAGEAHDDIVISDGMLSSSTSSIESHHTDRYDNASLDTQVNRNPFEDESSNSNEQHPMDPPDTIIVQEEANVNQVPTRANLVGNGNPPTQPPQPPQESNTTIGDHQTNNGNNNTTAQRIPIPDPLHDNTNGRNIIQSIYLEGRSAGWNNSLVRGQRGDWIRSRINHWFHGADGILTG